MSARYMKLPTSDQYDDVRLDFSSSFSYGANQQAPFKHEKYQSAFTFSNSSYAANKSDVQLTRGKGTYWFQMNFRYENCISSRYLTKVFFLFEFELTIKHQGRMILCFYTISWQKLLSNIGVLIDSFDIHKIKPLQKISQYIHKTCSLLKWTVKIV